MIAIYFTAETTVLKNRLPPLKKEQHRNPLPPLKKEQRNPVATLTSCWHRSARRKNSAKRSPTRLLLGWEDPTGIGPRDGRPVTTSHLFWPNQPRSATSLPPNWLRNPGPAAAAIVALLLPGNETLDFASASVPIGPPRGVHRCGFGIPPRRVRSHGIFSTNGLPYSGRYEKHCPKPNS